MTHSRDIAALPDLAAARSFYEDVLRGRQVWSTEATGADADLWFLVDGTLIQVCAASDADRPPFVLAVRAPVELAARCWDAGFDVRVHDDVGGQAMLSVVDPLGREIALARRQTVVRARGRRRLPIHHHPDKLN